ncbi:MAG TPA: hypothetical protein DDX98_15720 [Bacteroidales bacterium]|jgi:hypothetical protein|nr:hypothetical protein [Bacteroidales bacterium]
MAGLKTLLGLYPKTTDYEEKRIELQKEYNALLEFEKSDELKHFKELEETVTSEKFKIKQQEILRLRYKGSEEFNKEKEFQQLSKSKDIKLYLKTAVSEELAVYKQMSESDDLKRLKELEKFVQSEAFLKAKNHYKLSAKKRFEISDLGHTQKQYKQKSKSEEIKGYFKFIGHKLYPNFKEIKDSDKLRRFEELKALVESHEFTSKKHSMKKAEFKESEEGKLWDEFTQLSKAKDVKDYFKLNASHQKKYYDTLHDSDELHAYDDLEKFILSHDFKEQKKAIMEKGFHDTDEYKKFRELEQLKKDENMKIYFKFAKSKELSNYKQIDGSDKLARYHELDAYIKTDEFIDRKAYLTLKPKERWKQSEEYARLDEYNRLKDSEMIKWFFKDFSHKKFDWFRTWNLTFNDEFDGGKLDTKKWLTRYYWGEEMLHNTYSLLDEKHYISDGKNLDFTGSHLKIITRKEKADGLKWNPDLGFVPSEFEYTSGLINSGKSFRQQYGLFEAKIKFANAPKVLNAFWMVGDEQTPHIDVAKANGKCSVGIQTDTETFKKKLSRSKFSGNYFIYAMEWSADKITWSINGLEVASTSKNIPQDEMYVALSAGLYEEIQDGNIPAMEVDWIRCYEKTKKEK